MDLMMMEDFVDCNSRLLGGRCPDSSMQMVCNDAIMEEASSSSSSLAHFDYTGTYRLTSIYNDMTMQTIQTDPTSTASFTFQPTSDDEYDLIICLTNRIQGSIRVAPNDDESKIVMETTRAGCSLDAFDEIVDVTNLSVVPAQPGASPKLMEVILAAILSKCDMIRFVGDRLVLEGPSGAIECIISPDDE
jgi:hypothetical protein